jgi:NAD(P)-dependent dehydrogenase (short-subunit alcohol dehydrogenase family)
VPQATLTLPDRVLVTGAAGGIGAAIVRRLATAGVSVLGTDVVPAPAGYPGRDWIRADLCTAEGRRPLKEAAGGALGGIVYAAGIIDPAGWDLVEEEAADRLFALNVKAPYFLVRELIPGLSENAAIVLLGSIASLRGSPHTPFYAASKAALRNIAASLATPLAVRGVRVNVLAPGLIDTPLTDRLNDRLATQSARSIAEIAAERAAQIPLGRAGTPEEVANACAFLLSREASYVAGSTLFVTGCVLAGAI